MGPSGTIWEMSFGPRNGHWLQILKELAVLATTYFILYSSEGY